MFIVVGLLYIIHMTPFPSQEMHKTTVQPGGNWLSQCQKIPSFLHQHICFASCLFSTWDRVTKHYNHNRKKRTFVKKGPKKDHFSSLVLKRTKSLIKDLYGSTASIGECGSLWSGDLKRQTWEAWRPQASSVKFVSHFFNWRTPSWQRGQAPSGKAVAQELELPHFNLGY